MRRLHLPSLSCFVRFPSVAVSKDTAPARQCAFAESFRPTGRHGHGGSGVGVPVFPSLSLRTGAVEALRHARMRPPHMECAGPGSAAHPLRLGSDCCRRPGRETAQRRDRREGSGKATEQNNTRCWKGVRVVELAGCELEHARLAVAQREPARRRAKRKKKSKKDVRQLCDVTGLLRDGTMDSNGLQRKDINNDAWTEKREGSEGRRQKRKKAEVGRRRGDKKRHRTGRREQTAAVNEASVKDEWLCCCYLSLSLIISSILVGMCNGVVWS
jgi:hypothetical protein